MYLPSTLTFQARDYAGSCDTVASPEPARTPAAPRATPAWHFTRCGNFRNALHHAQIAERFRRLARVGCHKIVKCSSISITSARLLPFNFIVINEADAWLMAHPCPLNLMSSKPPFASNFAAR
jgi:hypothetical protein